MEFTTTPEAKMTVTAYLNEKVNYGGIEVTRGEMIADLEAVAATWTDDPIRQKQIVGMYMMGFDSPRR